MKRIVRSLLLVILLSLSISCQSGPHYNNIPIPDRKLNLLGLEMIATEYLNNHPRDFYKFHRIITEADNALQEHHSPTRGAVMKWISKTLEKEGFNQQMPVYLFLRAVYLKGWEGAYFTRVDEDEREYLYDLMGAAMGGMHRCSTCSTNPNDE